MYIEFCNFFFISPVIVTVFTFQRVRYEFALMWIHYWKCISNLFVNFVKYEHILANASWLNRPSQIRHFRSDRGDIFFRNSQLAHESLVEKWWNLGTKYFYWKIFFRDQETPIEFYFFPYLFEEIFFVSDLSDILQRDSLQAWELRQKIWVGSDQK